MNWLAGLVGAVLCLAGYLLGRREPKRLALVYPGAPNRERIVAALRKAGYAPVVADPQDVYVLSAGETPADYVQPDEALVVEARKVLALYDENNLMAHYAADHEDVDEIFDRLRAAVEQQGAP